MSRALILTVIGKDRPGLVEAISRVVGEHEANWEASHMSRLCGRFAGILQVSVDETRAESLARSLEELVPVGLRVIVEDSIRSPQPSGQVYRLELVGSDQPNIVHDISEALTSREVAVLEITSELSDAPHGVRLFKMQASIRCPSELSSNSLRASLEEVAHSLMVDLKLDE